VSQVWAVGVPYPDHECPDLPHVPVLHIRVRHSLLVHTMGHKHHNVSLVVLHRNLVDHPDHVHVHVPVMILVLGRDRIPGHDHDHVRILVLGRLVPPRKVHLHMVDLLLILLVRPGKLNPLDNNLVKACDQEHKIPPVPNQTYKILPVPRPNYKPFVLNVVIPAAKVKAIDVNKTLPMFC